MSRKYTEEQRKVIMEESFNFCKKLKDSRLFGENVPPIAHNYIWAFLSMLADKEPQNTLDRQASSFLNGITWSTL